MYFAVVSTDKLKRTANGGPYGIQITYTLQLWEEFPRKL